MAHIPTKVLFIGCSENIPKQWAEAMQKSHYDTSYAENDSSEIDELGWKKLLRNDVVYIDFRDNLSQAKIWAQSFSKATTEGKDFSIIAIVSNENYGDREIQSLCDDVIDSRCGFDFFEKKTRSSVQFHQTLKSFKNEFYYPVENAVLTYNHEINNKLTVGMWAAEEGLMKDENNETLLSAMKSFKNILEIVKNIEVIKREKLGDHKAAAEDIKKAS